MMALDPTRFGMQPHKFGGLVTPPLKLRAFSFLSDERTHPDIRNGVVDVAVVRKRQGGDIGGGTVTLSRHATNEQLKRQLAGVESARVLRLSDAEGAFGGWETDKQQATLFSTMMEYYLHRGAWCCSSRNNGNEDGRVYTKNPPPFKIPRA